MKHYQQFRPVIIESFEADTWNHPLHGHNHYELIYIRAGSGRHQINQHEINYEAGDFFLLGPDEAHVFEIDERTRFVYIKFTDAYLHGQNAQALEYLIKSRETHLSNFRLKQSDQQSSDRIIQVMLSLHHDLLSNEPIIRLQLLALAEILRRNMPEIQTSSTRNQDMQALFCYLHQSIYDPAKLRATAIAARFHFSPEYIGPYFKRQTGQKLSHYIAQYRRTLIQKRLEHGNYTLKQIAAEFGLSDESHVRKIMASC